MKILSSNAEDYTLSSFTRKNIVWISLVRRKTVEWQHVCSSIHPLLTTQELPYLFKKKELDVHMINFM